MSDFFGDTDLITAPAVPDMGSIALVHEGVAMMDDPEAREYLKMMQWDLEAADSALTNFRARALDFAEREGWRALGYAGAIEALQTELGAQYSKSYLSRILKAGEIERVLELPIGQLPERTIRPLAQLDTPDQQRQAYQTIQGKPTTAKVQQAVDQIKPPTSKPSVIAASNQAFVDTCADRRALLDSADTQHTETIKAILKEAADKGERTGTALYQQAYDHAREIHDLALHNKMIALIDRATDAPEAPAPAASISARDYDDRESIDMILIDKAAAAIAGGDTDRARDLLDQVQVATWKRDQLLATIAPPAKGEPIVVFPALSVAECKVLIREAKVFIESGADRKLPTIGKALRIAARMALEATE